MYFVQLRIAPQNPKTPFRNMNQIITDCFFSMSKFNFSKFGLD